MSPWFIISLVFFWQERKRFKDPVRRRPKDFEAINDHVNEQDEVEFSEHNIKKDD
jgi:hypothetical protein